MALWGATKYANGDYVDVADRFGMDLRLQMSVVPLPAALPLFGAAAGVMGLVGGWRRKRKAALAAA
jgi:hypothetical protein